VASHFQKNIHTKMANGTVPIKEAVIGTAQYDQSNSL
jgi:hypothetical protein